MVGRLIGIARRTAKRAPMELLQAASIERESGLQGDSRGRFKKRAVTILARESWEAARADIAGAPDLPWTMRRANLLIEDIDLPHVKGTRLQIGGVVLEITGEAEPCARMDEQYSGLTSALLPAWRGGFTARVVRPGEVSLGGEVRLAAGDEKPG